MISYGIRRIGKIPFEINRRELYIYSGYRNIRDVPDAAVDQLIDACLEELRTTAEPKAVLRTEEIHRTSEAEFSIGDFSVSSEALGKNLRGCRDAILAGATLSTSVDLLLHRYSKLAITKSVLMQASAAAYIEAYLDEIMVLLRKELAPDGLDLCPRFSPGFADFGTAYQAAFLESINAKRYLGISLLGDSDMLVPTKSVTAVIGIKGAADA